MDGMDFGIPDTDSQLGDHDFELGESDEFAMEGDFEIPGFSTVPLENKFLVVQLYCDTAGRIWIVTRDENGLYVYSEKQFQIYKSLNSFTNPIITTITQDSTDAFWFGVSPYYAVKVNAGEETVYNLSSGKQKSSIVNSIFQDSAKNMWFGLDTGITILHDGNYYYYDKEILKNTLEKWNEYFKRVLNGNEEIDNDKEKYVSGYYINGKVTTKNALADGFRVVDYGKSVCKNFAGTSDSKIAWYRLPNNDKEENFGMCIFREQTGNWHTAHTSLGMSGNTFFTVLDDVAETLSLLVQGVFSGERNFTNDGYVLLWHVTWRCSDVNFIKWLQYKGRVIINDQSVSQRECVSLGKYFGRTCGFWVSDSS